MIDPRYPFQIVKHRTRGVCIALRCTNTCRSNLCPKHAHRLRKFRDPVAYTYNLLKSNARRRGKAFDLTLEEFRAFCDRTGYLAKKGKHSYSFSIDRIDPLRGYSADNIQILRLSTNSVKRWEDYLFKRINFDLMSWTEWTNKAKVIEIEATPDQLMILADQDLTIAETAELQRKGFQLDNVKTTKTTDTTQGGLRRYIFKFKNLKK